MKKLTLVAGAVLGLVSATSAMAQSSVTLYGIVDAAVTYTTKQNAAGDSRTGIDAGQLATSRWGMRGTEDLGGGLKANFNLEGTLINDTGAAGLGFGGNSAPGVVPVVVSAAGSTTSLFDRQATVGLSGGFGSINLGRQNILGVDSIGLADPISLAQPAINPNVAFSALNRGDLYGGYGTNGGGAALRQNNSIRYVTPIMSGFGGALTSPDIDRRLLQHEAIRRCGRRQRQGQPVHRTGQIRAEQTHQHVHDLYPCQSRFICSSGHQPGPDHHGWQLFGQPSGRGRTPRVLSNRLQRLQKPPKGGFFHGRGPLGALGLPLAKDTRQPMTTALDSALNAADSALRTLFAKPRASRTCPTVAGQTTELSVPDKALSGALMRVNHVGEVCAQAMYAAQALSTRDPALRQHFLAASQEEGDHLAWTRERLDELGARPSLLNPLWYAGAFGLGLIAGRLGDRVSLGFVVETERQVEAHLAQHLERLPAGDHESRAIVAQMKDDEARHGQEAQNAGAASMPAPVRALMQASAKLMTTTAHYL
ncbi:MAG: hypothetical protein B7X59_13090 [Polaromonas sp. 39-63-203]|nr:MAG: hypothetical protein B7X59_13090 [Polaromonas sp. 39-63-203]